MSALGTQNCGTCPVTLASSGSSGSSATRAYKVFVGTADPPSSGDYVDNDLYCNSANFKCYVRSGSSWTQVTNYSAQPDLSGYATQSYVDGTVFLGKVVSAVVSADQFKSLVSSEVSSQLGGSSDPVALQSWVRGLLASYAKTTDLPSTSTFVTQEWATATFMSKDTDVLGTAALDGYATQAWVSGRGYATQTWVSDQKFLTSAAANLASYATKDDIAGFADASATTPSSSSTDGNVPTAKAVYTYGQSLLALAKQYADAACSGFAVASEVPSVDSSISASSPSTSNVPTSKAVVDHVASKVSGLIDTTTLSSSSTNGKAAGSKLVYDFITANIDSAVAASIAKSPTIVSDEAISAVRAQEVDEDDATTMPSCKAVADYVGAAVGNGFSYVKVAPVGTPTYSVDDTAYYALKDNAVNHITLSDSAISNFTFNSVDPQLYLNLRLPTAASHPSRLYLRLELPDGHGEDGLFVNFRFGDSAKVYRKFFPYGYPASSAISSSTFYPWVRSSPLFTVLELIEVGDPASSVRTYVLIPWRPASGGTSVDPLGNFTVPS